MLALILVLIAVIILLLIWAAYPRTEYDHRDKFKHFVMDTLGQISNDKTCITPIDLCDPVSLLTDKDQIVVIGMNHLSVIGAPWALFLVTELNDYKRVFPTIDGDFWVQRLSGSSNEESDATCITGLFEIQEIVWTNRDTVQCRAYRITRS